AVVENSRVLGRDPQERLEEMLPHLGRLVATGVLVQAGSKSDKEVRPQYESGATIAGWKIVRCVNLVEDSEIYQLRRGQHGAGLKMARSLTAKWLSIFENEIEVLRYLDGKGIAPRLIDAGTDQARPYLIMEWVPGVDVGATSAQRRFDRAALIDLAASAASAY